MHIQQLPTARQGAEDGRNGPPQRLAISAVDGKLQTARVRGRSHDTAVRSSPFSRPDRSIDPAVRVESFTLRGYFPFDGACRSLRFSGG
jgi:hypothetical protein